MRWRPQRRSMDGTQIWRLTSCIGAMDCIAFMIWRPERMPPRATTLTGCMVSAIDSTPHNPPQPVGPADLTASLVYEFAPR